MNRTMKFSGAAFGMMLLAGLAYYQGRMDQALGEEDKLVGAAVADTAAMEPIEGNSPTRSLPERDAYFPGTEALAADEMRVIACGTGMPNARPRQAAACFLVELGNGDKFIFDIGLGSAERISAMQIPYDYLDKVFIGHLHADQVPAVTKKSWVRST
jgi:ribonuclease Z